MLSCVSLRADSFARTASSLYAIATSFIEEADSYRQRQLKRSRAWQKTRAFVVALFIKFAILTRVPGLRGSAVTRSVMRAEVLHKNLQNSDSQFMRGGAGCELGHGAANNLKGPRAVALSSKL